MNVARHLYNVPWQRLAPKKRPMCLRSRWRGVHSTLLRQMATIQPHHIIKSPHSDISITPQSLSEYTWKHLSAWEDSICIECAVTGQKYTYAQVRDGARRFAVSLQKLGLKARDVIVLVLPNTPDYPIVLLGALEAGLTVSSINPIYTGAEIAKQINDCDAKCMVTDNTRFAAVSEALQLSKRTNIPVISAGSKEAPSGTIDVRNLIDKSVDMSTLVEPDDPSPDDVAVLPYSSGTTGLAKGVMLTHHCIVSNLYQINDARFCLTNPTSGEFQEILPAVLPFFHIYGMVVILLGKMAQGARILSLPKFEPTEFINMLRNYKNTGLYVAPPLLLFMATNPNIKSEMLSSLKFVMSGAAPLGAKDVERLLSKVPDVSVVQGYGMTETSPVLTQGVIGDTNYGSVGKCLSNTTAMVLDSNGNSLGTGQQGEVCFKGPQIMKGYLNNLEATEEIIDKNGFIHTGDIGYYDENNYFYIIDRVKELIKVRGYQVPPAELEELIRSHPHVLDAAVVGVPDERSGEVPRAYVVPRKGISVTEKDITEFVKSKAASYKHLAGGVVFTDSIPKNLSGKILRRQLKELVSKNN